MSKMDRIDRAFAARKPIDDALTRGVRREMAIQKRLGHSVVGWEDGRVVWIPAEEIPVDIEESDNPKPYPVPESEWGV
jgi:hypothetical protein